MDSEGGDADGTVAVKTFPGGFEKSNRKIAIDS